MSKEYEKIEIHLSTIKIYVWKGIKQVKRWDNYDNCANTPVIYRRDKQYEIFINFIFLPGKIKNFIRILFIREVCNPILSFCS